MFIGTAYFASKIEAIRCFEKDGISRKRVEQYIEEKIIRIGVPKVKSEFDLCLDEDGRYWTKKVVKKGNVNESI